MDISYSKVFLMKSSRKDPQRVERLFQKRFSNMAKERSAHVGHDYALISLSRS